MCRVFVLAWVLDTRAVVVWGCIELGGIGLYRIVLASCVEHAHAVRGVASRAACLRTFPSNEGPPRPSRGGVTLHTDASECRQLV